MNQTINNYIEKTEILLKYSSVDVEQYAKPFLGQLNKLKGISDEVLSDKDGLLLMAQIATYFELLNRDLVDLHELFVQLIGLTIRSVLIVKANKEFNRVRIAVDYKPFILN